MVTFKDLQKAIKRVEAKQEHEQGNKDIIKKIVTSKNKDKQEEQAARLQGLDLVDFMDTAINTNQKRALSLVINERLGEVMEALGLCEDIEKLANIIGYIEKVNKCNNGEWRLKYKSIQAIKDKANLLYIQKTVIKNLPDLLSGEKNINDIIDYNDDIFNLLIEAIKKRVLRKKAKNRDGVPYLLKFDWYTLNDDDNISLLYLMIIEVLEKDKNDFDNWIQENKNLSIKEVKEHIFQFLDFNYIVNRISLNVSGRMVHRLTKQNERLNGQISMYQSESLDNESYQIQILDTFAQSQYLFDVYMQELKSILDLEELNVLNHLLLGYSIQEVIDKNIATHYRTYKTRQKVLNHLYNH